MNDVFLSYASEDRERAGLLAQCLEARGWSVWWDREIVAGDAFDHAIEEQLESAKCIVVLWSKASISSEWVKNEASVAAERGVLTPARIDDVRLPLEFRRRQTVSLLGWNGDHEDQAFVELCHHVEAKIHGTPLPELPPDTSAILERRNLLLLASVLVVVVAIALGVYRSRSSQGAQVPPAADAQTAGAEDSVPADSDSGPEAKPAPPRAAAKITLRRTPSTLSGDMVKVLLAERGLYDKSSNPGGAGISNRYKAQIHGGAVVVSDDATGLIWQKGGSADPMSFDLTPEYISRLNSEKYAGFDDWRLPTLEETLSLMEPQVVDERHIDQIFERDVPFMWTADRFNDERSWMVYFYDGIAALERITFNAWVRAVRSE